MSFVFVCEQGMQIHISQTTKDHLEHEPYIIEERGKIFVKVSGLQSGLCISYSYLDVVHNYCSNLAALKKDGMYN